MLKECPNCGSTGIGASEMFCPNCGEALFSQARDETPRGGDAGPAVTGPGESYVMPYGANTDASQAGGYAPLARQTPVHATDGYSYQKERKRTKRIYTVVGIIILAGVVLGFSYVMYVSYFKGTKMELAKPDGWQLASSGVKKDAEGTIMFGGRVNVDFYYLNSDGQLLLGYHLTPASDNTLSSLPDTQDLPEMEAFITEHNYEMQMDIADRGDLPATIEALSLDCGNVALKVSGTVTKNGTQAPQIQIITEKGTTLFLVTVVNIKLESSSEIVQYVVKNLEFK